MEFYIHAYVIKYQFLGTNNQFIFPLFKALYTTKSILLFTRELSSRLHLVYEKDKT